MSLALKYRPKKFPELVGQKAVYGFLAKMVEHNSVPTALLFEGSHGTGKTSAARILSAALNCNDADSPCGTCASCVAVFEGTSLDMIEIDAASNGLVDDVRALRETLNYDTPGKRRLVLLDEAHGMSKAAFNALLKTLEEPPEDTTFVLLSTDPAKILDTVKSRCMPFMFRRVPVPEIVVRLNDIVSLEDLRVEESLLSLIAERSAGSMRNAIVELDRITSADVVTLKDYVEVTYEPDVYARLLRACVCDDFSTVYSALEEAINSSPSIMSVGSNLTLVLRDVLVLHAKGELSQRGDSLKIRQELATLIPALKALSAIRILWDLNSKLKVGESNRGLLDLSVAVLAQTLQGDEVVYKTLPKPAPHSMTLSEMEERIN